MMSFCQYFLCFAVFSFIGWAYETVYYSIQQRKFVNSGFLSTCFCPIYGMGAMLDLILLGWIENPLILFLREWWLPARLNILYRGFWKRCFIKDGGIIQVGPVI